MMVHIPRTNLLTLSKSKHFAIDVHPPKSQIIKKVIWIPPLCNSDGSTRGSPGHAATNKLLLLRFLWLLLLLKWLRRRGGITFGLSATLPWSFMLSRILLIEVNSCADKVANFGVSFMNTSFWSNFIPSFPKEEFLRNRQNLPNYSI
ncbi:hypothetical protein HKD37_06G016315 [Glycine soja]